MDSYATNPQTADPYSPTVYDPREQQKRVGAVMARAKRSRIPAPGSYWEAPGHHGTGREVILRRARSIPLFNTTETSVRKALRLPPLPKPQRMSGGTMALVAVGAIGTGVVIGYLWTKRKRELARRTTPSHTSVSGFELLGCEQ